ncbi:MAG: VWA domain-containing protein [Anaerolineaceae bacterium]|nr:VWA domain-containing protein [Anaerolineaceae bacterium]
MKKSLRSFLILLLLMALFLLPACQATPRVESSGDYVLQITQIDTTQFPLVNVYVSVRDSAGEPQVINTGKLQLLENGQPVNNQSIQGSGEVGPLTTMLLIDNSGSMNFVGKLDSAKAVAKEYLDQMRSVDQAGVITFNTKVAVVQDITADREALLKAIDSITARDDTAVYDALSTAIGILNPLPGRKAIIVLTDGMDNSSKTTSEGALGAIGFGGLSISTVGFGQLPEGEEQTDQYKGIDVPTLRMIAENAGGQYGYAEDKAQLSALYDQMRRALQSEAVISYVTPLSLRDGVQRALTMTLSDRFIGVGGESQTSFNPGGLVPEVAKPAPWITFGIILAVLVLLLFIPVVVSIFTNKESKKKKRRKIKITLKD